MTAGDRSSTPLRVVHVALGLEMGGLEKLLVEIARHADRRRQELRFVSLGGRGALGAEIEKNGWQVTALEEPEGLRPGLVPRLAGLFRGWRPDVVHTHNTKALVYGGPASRLARVPRLIHTWHGQNLLASPREALLFRLLGNLPDLVVAVSDDAAAGLVAREGVAAARVRRIWNGIDLNRFAYFGPQPGGSLVTVARLSPEKDLETLIKALALLRPTHQGLRLEVAGDGPCLPALRAVAEQLGVGDRVRFLGQVRDVPALLARASLFVLPSLTEGVSLTLLEAMARGLPVVATRVGGNPEVVADGQTGLLVPAGDAAELARAIQRLWGDPETGRRMGLSGRQRVEARFEVRGMVAQYEALYREGRPGRSLPTDGERRHTRKPRVLSNLPGLSDPPASALLDNDMLPRKSGPLSKALRGFLGSFSHDAVVLDQAPEGLALLCALRALVPCRLAPLVSVDLVLSRPHPSLTGQLKGFLKKLLLKQVDLFLMHMKDTREVTKCYGIRPRRMRYVPFKVNQLDRLHRWASAEQAYVFTGGRSRRDYRTFCGAMAGLEYPGVIVTPRAAENAEHGTDLSDLTPPPNVRVIHDDGSMDSWLAKLARARLAVFCITPETISPSGVSAYLMAMALGKCVVISDCPATRGILLPDETAILVPMRDPAALREAVRRAWQDDAYRERIAEGGRRYALSLGGADVLMRNIARELVELLEGC